MPWARGGKADKAYASKQHQSNRAHWKRLRQPCARCGQSIDYDAPYRIIRQGRNTINPRAFVCGHIVSKRKARLMGWPESKVNALENSQPECARCSTRSGAAEGQVARTKPIQRIVRYM